MSFLRIQKFHQKNFGKVLIKSVHELAPRNKELIQIREDLQKKIDGWHIKNKR